MKVHIPSALRSYTDSGQAEASGATLAAMLADLDRSYPGIRFRMIDEQDRIRRHMRIFVGQDEAKTIAVPVRDGGELLIFGALSGG